VYPQIWGTLSPEFEKILPLDFQKYTSLRTSDDNLHAKRGTPSPGSEIAPDKLIKSLSYSHFAELIEIEDPLKRAFYEVESILGTWSVRELKRQIDSLYYERSSLSKNKKKLAKLVQKGVEKSASELPIRDPYVFEFLGLRPEQVIPESDLENELIIRLQEFLMELGTGFCFEARQKRILIGDTYGFIDLVFYHRVLKCHILVELKRSRFTHEDIGQLNTYVSWYKKNISSDGDNPPIGILLCTKKDHTLVEYALAGMSNQLFVSKYQLELPDQEAIRRFIEEQTRNLFGESDQIRSDADQMRDIDKKARKETAS
jgi:predicted nuclease of restriction endonuclease-like (RecB) superfamily